MHKWWGPLARGAVKNQWELRRFERGREERGVDGGSDTEKRQKETEEK